MKKIICFIALALSLAACSLDEDPKSQVAKGPVFSSEEGLAMYANSFYGTFLGPSALTTWGSAWGNFYSVHEGVNTFMTDKFNASMQGSWGWGTLRNINYFLMNNTNEAVPESVRNNYNGLARFFRAYFYFNMMKTYGDLPWIDRTLDVKDTLLTAARQPRTYIADRIYEDFEYAVNHISSTSDATCTTVTKYVAAAFESRFCLWEGTYRKYTPSAGLQSTAELWLKRAQQAAETVINSGQFGLYTDEGPAKSYRALFIAKEPKAKEVMLASVFDSKEGLVNAETRKLNTTTLGGPLSPLKQVVNLYLKLDGKPFTDDPSYKTTPFTEEFKNRDYRASQTIRTPGFTRISNGKEVRTAPDYACGYVGYHGMKFALDDVTYDGVDVGENNFIIMRYAEVLLNWVEAKAELGTLTDADWARSIGALRARAGITGGLTSKPTKIDKYLQQTFFPDITDPVILEVRRERILELMWEDGMDYAEVQRWHCGKLYELPEEGIYVPEFNKALDMDGDGNPDVCFYTTDTPPSTIAGVYYRKVQLTPDAEGRYSTPVAVASDGHTLLYNMNVDPVKWKDRMYFYPIAQADIILNPNLKQNPGYE